MANVKVTLTFRTRWFFWPLLLGLSALHRLGLFGDRPSALYIDGLELWHERMAALVVGKAVIIGVDLSCANPAADSRVRS